MALLLLLTCSCGSVAIKEETLYTDVTPDGSIVGHLYSAGTSRMGQAAWDAIREGMTCISPEALGDIKTEIEQLCSATKCNIPSQSDMRKFVGKSTQLFNRLEANYAASRK